MQRPGSEMIISGIGEIWELNEDNAQQVDYAITITATAKPIGTSFTNQTWRQDRPRFEAVGQISFPSDNPFRNPETVLTLRLENLTEIRVKISAPCPGSGTCDLVFGEYTDLETLYENFV